MSGPGRCDACGGEVDARTGFRLVQGFERIHRSAGGTNALAHREPQDVYRCAACVRVGATPGQGRLS